MSGKFDVVKILTIYSRGAYIRNVFCTLIIEALCGYD